MPELPEVETTRRGIQPFIEGKRIKQVIVRDRRLRWPVIDEFESLLSGQRIRSVSRRGKYLVFDIGSGYFMLHLGMSGVLCVVDGKTALKAHDHIDIIFSKNVILRYNDPRRFGSAHWISTDPNQHFLLEKLGPEPLSAAFSAQHLFEKAARKRIAVKNFIMDSHVVVGVGNIYANEALFLAGIKPTVPASKVSLARYEKLTIAIKEVLKAAIKQGGTTLKDFKGSDGKPGYFKQALKVYGRAGEPCYSCQSPLQEIRLGQRATVYCTRCQR